MNFSRRSYKKELLDRDDIPFDDIKRNMEELDFINTYLGGHLITIAGLKQLLRSSSPANGDKWLICEIGCGGGDNLAAIQKWLKKKNIPAGFVGIDINPFCIEVAKTKLKDLGATLITSDYKAVNFAKQKPDIIFSSLFCHHFTNEDLVPMLHWMRTNAGVGFFINDLQRNPLAFYLINILANLFSKSYLVKNDAPLSVLRGFKKKEWKNILESAGIHKYTINWKWAFRHLVIVRKSETGN